MLEPAPFFAEVADAPDGAEAYWATCEDGVRIRLGWFPKQDARGTVLLFPGRTEYIEKYGRAARDLAKRGYSTLCIDWRGQGIADRLLPNRLAGHVGAFADYQLDVAMALAAADHLGAPGSRYLIAHSMGGGIGLRALHEGLPVKAAAFSGPMWGIQMHYPLRVLAWGLSSLAIPLGMGRLFPPATQGPHTMVNDPFEGNLLTRDRDMYAYMIAQLKAHPDLGLGGPTLQWVNLALKETRALASMSPPDLPTVTFLGTDEKIVDPARIHSLMSRWRGGKLEMVQDGEHEVMMEVPASRQAFFDSACALFDNRA